MDAVDTGREGDRMTTAIHICTPPSIDARIVRIDCPTCERRSYATRLDYEWYGPTTTCLRCGEAWSDGERHERPFAPRWRQERVRQAKEVYRAARRRLDRAAGEEESRG